MIGVAPQNGQANKSLHTTPVGAAGEFEDVGSGVCEFMRSATFPPGSVHGFLETHFGCPVGLL